MRLTTIKLSGFKSFVDPTTLHLPTNMTGVVGPNGCGKSNIIDAVRWVMGESAASRLRGDSLTDVIFSGSSARKPVGTAMVELVFDNSDGTIIGEYANYNEISVKRSVSRDGTSQYYLNNGRCRRRDITDLFLGTGLGPRSYSIIEQGMISHIVSAHPEELRTHLEEAAGISKYKERRKETESRIKSTRENLERLNDVRDEVEKQLDHLKRQAKAAERWQELKNEQTRREAELRGLTYRAIAAELSGQGETLRQAELQIEAFTADQRQIEAQLESQRVRHGEASERLNIVQAEVYRTGGEIARVEQQIQHNRELTERLERTRVETEQAWAELSEHIRADAQQIEILKGSLADSEPRLNASRAAAEQAAEAARTAEAKLAEWQTQWDAYAKASAEATSAAEVERTRLDYLDRQCLDVSKQLEKLREEQTGADLNTLNQQIETFTAEQDEQKTKVEHLTKTLAERKAAHDQLLESERTTLHALNAARQELQTFSGRLASLEALQHAALGQEKSEATEWLERLGLNKTKRLGEVLVVDAGWERAVETVLTGLLEGVLVEDPVAHAAALAQLQNADLALIDSAESTHMESSGTLAAKVRGPAAVLNLLASVHIANDLEQVAGLVTGLEQGHSVITPEGEWFGVGYVRVLRNNAKQIGVLAREREIHELTAKVEALNEQAGASLRMLEELKIGKVEAERQRDEVQRELYIAHRRLAELSGQLQSHRGRLESAQTRLQKIEQDIVRLTEKGSSDQADSREARVRLEQAVARMGDQEQVRLKLDALRRQLLEAREEARANARETSEQSHQLALSIESKRSSIVSLEQALLRMHSQHTQLETRKAEVAEQLTSSKDPMADLEAQRKTYLDQRLLIDKQLVEARKALEECDGDFRQLEQERHRVEHRLNQCREALSEQRLAEQSLKLRAESLSAAIVAAGLELETVLSGLADDADAGRWQEQLTELEHKIKRLEPVNLAAIQEFEEQSQRKNYLDAQLTDLTTALETLENAIKKIDKETRQRFKETFDRVNTGLQELFPRLFGGGHAYLELTSDDLLDTGVTIMARPPGKRVSSITLLSGGEKALCAVALVFSIFRLNPAPFCLLDEVDAPLDEANVGRFSQLVAEMSEQVQFLFVTHNKATMEAAVQLCGVTMREPGVSRLVQVDLAEAAKLAGAA